MPAVLLMLTFAIQALAVQVDRIELANKVGQLARSAARGEAVSKTMVEGKLICVERSITKFIYVSEKQCAHRLGL
jgi:predicted metalloenzyme YecM